MNPIQREMLTRLLQIAPPRTLDPPSKPDDLDEGLGLVDNTDPEDPVVLINPKLDVYLKKGFTEAVLEQFFNLETGELKPEYSNVKEEGGGMLLPSREKYKNKFIFEDAKNPGTFTEVTAMEDGTTRTKIVGEYSPINEKLPNTFDELIKQLLKFLKK